MHMKILWNHFQNFRKLFWSSERYIKYLRSLGVEVGDRVQIVSPNHTTLDIMRPWMLKIGSDVIITTGVTILTHGADGLVIKRKYGDLIGSSGLVVIGNNVFVGANTTILKNTKIGNNVIIGANSLVNKDIPDNVVVAGNPAEVIMSLDEYRKKRLKAQLTEAQELVKRHYEVYGKAPEPWRLRDFFWLFDDKASIKEYEEKLHMCGNYEESLKKFKMIKPKYNGIEEFFNECKKLD